ncbi:MAG: 2OG-Fe(II) oxygenase [Pseudomonadota bacterium]|nr:2OG-Fe(II) oxygenase [Pseudomonadota bacterium]
MSLSVDVPTNMVQACPDATPTIDWQQHLTDDGFSQLADTGMLVVDQLLPESLLSHLRLASRQSTGYQAAKLVHGGRQQQIRSDSTRWIESNDLIGAAYLLVLDALAAHLNQGLFLGIRWAEAHFACYQAGQFYAQHRDNPNGQSVRAISTVFYLNPDWPAAWGGQLRIVDRHGAIQEVMPLDNRLVIFDSDLLHEVCPATQTRYSIAGWLRRDDPQMIRI